VLTVMHVTLVTTTCYIFQDAGFRKVCNDRKDLGGHSRSLEMALLYTHDI